MFTSPDIGFLILCGVFIGTTIILGRAWSIVAIISTYIVALIAPVIPWLNDPSPRSAGVFVIVVGLLTVILRRRLFRQMKSSSLGHWLSAIPIGMIAGGFVFDRMLVFLPNPVFESFTYGARSIFFLPVSKIIWLILPLLVLVVLSPSREVALPHHE